VVVGGRDGCVVGVVEVAGGGFDYAVVVGVGVGLMMDMVMQGFLSLLLLVKDIDSILQLHEHRPLSIDMLPMRLSAMDYNLPSHDGLLFLLEPLNFLLDSGQLFLLCCFFFFGFFVLIMDLDLIKLGPSLNYLCWRRCSWGRLSQSASARLG
jgi:hypothetical protein